MRTTITSARTARTARRLGAVAALALTGALLVGCGSDDDAVASDNATQTSPSTDSPTSDSADSSEAPDVAGELPAWAPKILTDGDSVTGLDFTDVPEPSGELMVAQVTTGDGPPVESGQTITANYFGQLADADAPFDESFSRGPFQAAVGVGQLIEGWDTGLVGVPVGSRVVMEIPSDLGYGDAGTPDGSIPGGATLYFVVDIIDAQ